MQPSDMDKKREAFLEHLKQKYPHHASAIMGHQERLREQSRSPKQGAVCPSPVPAFGEQLEQGSLISLDALEVMSECDAPSPFTRGSRSRASLPVVRSTNQTKDRSLGVLYLQYGDDTKQIRMPNEITSVDTVRALFVSAFPQQLSMKMLESPSTAIYVKDDMRNMYYELSDVRSITDQSCLKVYHKDPAQAFSHGPRPSNGDVRMHREMMYAGRDGPVLMRQASVGPPPGHAMQGPMSSPTAHSMPPSPSRIPFGPRPPGPSGAAVPRERAGHTLPMPTRSASPCPSAILERRDVKPDEDVGSKNTTLPARGEGIYADPYMLHLHGPPPDAVDHAYHRAPVRSYDIIPPGMPMDPAEHHSLIRQKSRKYTESPLGAKTPPPSPHRMGEMRMIDIHAGQSQSALSLERSSPVRQSFRKDVPVSMERVVKGRNALASPVPSDLQAHCALVPTGDPQTRERMKAMEEQIASLTGLVQHALLKGPSVNSSDREHVSDRTVKSGSPVHSISSSGGSPVLGPRGSTVPPEGSPAPALPISSAPLQVNLVQFRKNVSELRLQLQQMRQLQFQNQECVRAQIKQAEQEISVRLTEAMRRQEDPSHKQRILVDEDRHKYLSMEEQVLKQLGDLEYYVESLKRGPDVTPHAVTLKEVEEGAVSLRKVGESLAGLKGEFPGLQARMRAVLRVEVEAVKFLKEEPHKLDSMLKRVKTLTDALSSLRRPVTEGIIKPPDPVTMPTLTAVDGVESALPTDLQDSVAMPLLEPQGSSLRSEVFNMNSMVIHHAQSSPVALRQSQQSAPSPTPTLLQQACETTPSSAKPAASPTLPQQACETTHSSAKPAASPAQPKRPTAEQADHAAPSSSVGNGIARMNVAPSNGAHDNGASPILFIEEIASHSKGKNRATSIEAAEREWEEKRQHMGHYDGPKFERMLQEAEANMLRGIPSLEVPSKGDSLQSPAAVPTSLEDMVEKTEPSAVPIQENNQAESPNPEKIPQTGPEKAPKPQLEKPAKASTMEKPAKPNLTVKASLDKAAKPQDKAIKLSQGPVEKANKSPPPPPPRRNYPTTPTTTGVTTTRSGQVVYTSRKETASAQEAEGEQNSAPKPKSKSPPEGKPKPCTSAPPPAAAVVEEDDGDKIMAELQNASVSSPTSRMPVPMSAKARQPPGTSDRERAAKQQKLQDSQRQFRQANGSAKRSGGDPKSTSPTMPASKIPAFSSSTGKGASQSDSTNPVNSLIVPSPSLPTNKSSIPTHRSIPSPSTHIPSLSNGSLKLAPATHSAKSLSLSTQTQNGRTSSSPSSTSHSPLSPTMLAQGVKSIRTIHTPNFVSYNRPHNVSAGKSAIPMATATKDTS